MTTMTDGGRRPFGKKKKKKDVRVVFPQEAHGLSRGFRQLPWNSDTMLSDYLPLVGPLPGAPDELVISGFSGGGLPFAFECGRVLAHAVAGREPVPGGALFNPRRFI